MFPTILVAHHAAHPERLVNDVDPPNAIGRQTEVLPVPTMPRSERRRLVERLALGGLLAIASLGLIPTSVAAVCVPVRGDIDGDGYADLLAGEPNRATREDLVGVLHVLPGAAFDGLQGEPDDQVFDQQDIADDPVPAAHFGTAVATGDFNGDCLADGAASSPNEGTGAVSVLSGSDAGLVPSEDDIFSAPEVESSLVNEHAHGFGSALASGDINGDGFDDLVVGYPQVTGNRGGIGILYGSSTGLGKIAGHSWFTQDTAAVPGTNEAGDRFGSSLAVGDIDGDGWDDVAIGVAHERVGSRSDAGSVTVLFGTSAGLSAAGAELWTQDTPGVPGTVEKGDLFGFSLAIGDTNADGWGDLAIGSPGETVGSIKSTGTVTILRGSADGLSGDGALAINQDTTGIPGLNEEGDKFGWSLTMGDFQGDTYADLAIGTPYENVGSHVNAGSVTTLLASSTGLSASGAKVWTEDDPHIAGHAVTGDHFGYALTTGRFSQSTWDDLIIGAPGQSLTGLIDDGVIHAIRGSATGLNALDTQVMTGLELTGLDPKSHGNLGQSLD